MTDKPTVPETPQAFLITGLPGSGKSTAAEMLEAELSHSFKRASHFEVSDYCRLLYDNTHSVPSDDIDDNELGEWTAKLKEMYGNGFIVGSMIRHINAMYVDDHPHVIISGLRSVEEVGEVWGHWPSEHPSRDVNVIAIWTKPDKRFERKYGDPPSMDHPKIEEFHQRNDREINKWGCGEFFEHENVWTDYFVRNNHGLGNLEHQMYTIANVETSDDPPEEVVCDGVDITRSPLPHVSKKAIDQYL